MLEILNVSSKGQVVIPEKVRKRHGIKSGSKLVLMEKEDSLILKKEDDVMKHLEESERKETIGWMMLAESSLKKLWDNPKDDEVWNKYL